MALVLGGAAMDAQLAPAYRWLHGAVAERHFPGGALAVGHKNLLALHPFGKFGYDAKATTTKPDTIYDAASLTKPVVTATLLAMLAESGEIDVDAPIARYLPECASGANPAWRARITIRHLLTHTSGLPAHRKYFQTLKSRRAIISAALAEPMEYEPGAQSVYSDVGFIALGEIVERVTGLPIDQLADDRIFAPLGMVNSFFKPPKTLLARVAPVSDDALRGKPLQRGAVHDDNARAMGGVAPHAGMFSTAGDLAVFCQMLLNGGIYTHRRLLRRESVEQFTMASPLSGNTRTLGWMAPTQPSSSGRYYSARGFGHLGFTGTSIWIDPEKQLFVVLLTNRVNPSKEKIRDLRAALHNAVVEALGLAQS
jgi:CubicO group peptidase (beta-lactamase class C family)